MEDILPYYAEDSLSAMFHDLLAELEPGCKGDAAFYLSLLRTSPADILELGCGSGREPRIEQAWPQCSRY